MAASNPPPNNNNGSSAPNNCPSSSSSKRQKIIGSLLPFYMNNYANGSPNASFPTVSAQPQQQQSSISGQPQQHAQIMWSWSYNPTYNANGQLQQQLNLQPQVLQNQVGTPAVPSTVPQSQKSNPVVSTPWCKLLSQQSEDMSASICTSMFSIGSESGCNLVLEPNTNGGILCSICNWKQLDGSSIPMIHCKMGTGSVQVNGRLLRAKNSCALHSGDELVFKLSQNHAYIFLLVGTESIALTSPSAGLSTAQTNAYPSTLVSGEENVGLASKNSCLIDDITSGVVYGSESQISFENFPYYLSESTKHILVASVFMHMKREHGNNMPKLQENGCPRILLSGPADSEIYQEILSMALARHFGANLLVFKTRLYLSGLLPPDTTKSSNDASRTPKPQTAWTLVEALRSSINANAPLSGRKLQPTVTSSSGKSTKLSLGKGDRVIYKGSKSAKPARGPTSGTRGKIVLDFESNKSSKIGVRFDKVIPGGLDLGGLCEAGHGFFCNVNEVMLEVQTREDYEKSLISNLFEAVDEERKNSPFILLLNDIEKSLTENSEAFQIIKSLISKLPENVIALGSHTQGESNNGKDTREMLMELFPNKITIDMPEDQGHMLKLKHQFKRDAEFLKSRNNWTCLRNVLIQTDLECEDITALNITDQVLTSKSALKAMKLALGYQLMQYPPNPADPKIVLSRASIDYGLNTLKETQTALKSSKKFVKDITTDNKFEEQLLADVIPCDEIGVKFDDVGALDNVKVALKEMVMLPLQRPELFCKGQLRQPCRGILLFGPPGTGKTMIAKAVATEAGANFINISKSSITSKWYGETEKYVKAIFTLASKLAPTVVFIDEIDSMLGKRGGHYEGDATRTFKNEFMLNWDGLRTDNKERVLILAATNRPFDLDDAVIRRMPHRLMVDLPDVSNRTKIIRVILWKEDLSLEVDFDLIASMTDGYSGSDLKNLCATAAYRPLRETLEKENEEHVAALAEGKPVPVPKGSSDIRPLNMEDFKYAKEKVSASLSSRSWSMKELTEWNELFGEGGSKRNTSTLSYYI